MCFKTLSRRFVRCRDGATVIEYALIAGMVTVAVVGALGPAGPRVATLIMQVSAAFGGG